jgi:hypothetical protein
MRISLESYPQYQVFLNYPYDPEYEMHSHALHFGIVAAGLRPVCAKDLSTPDRSRLDRIMAAINSCRYSLHDLSRLDQPRHNNTFELGVAFTLSQASGLDGHRCAGFVAAGLEHQRSLSNLAGFDLRRYHDEISLVVNVYEWLRDIVRDPVFSRQATAMVKDAYREFKSDLVQLEGSGHDGQASHDEAQELMFSMCGSRGWWDWRAIRAGQVDYPDVPLSWRSEVPGYSRK